MEPINIFSIASKHNRWLAVREQTVAQNIANANTPGYKSVDVEPFEAALHSTRTSTSHLTPTGSNAAATETREEYSWQHRQAAREKYPPHASSIRLKEKIHDLSGKVTIAG